MEGEAGYLRDILRYNRDPLLRFLAGKRLSRLAVAALAMAAIAIPVLGIGSIVSYVVHPTANIVRVLDPQHLYFALAVSFLVFPAIALIYVWQPQATDNTLRSLQKNGAIAEDDADRLASFLRSLKQGIGSPWLSLTAALAVAAIIAVETTVVYPAETRSLGAPMFWYFDKYYYFLVQVPIMFLMYYVAAMVALTGVATLYWFNRLFSQFPARVNPLDPDGAGGLGALGRLAVSYGWIAVFLGAVGATLTIVRLAIGSGWAQADTALLLALYVLLVPAALVLPLWSAHRTMQASRDAILAEISAEFSTVIGEGIATGSAEEQRKRLEALEGVYAVITRTYPTWPISTRLFRGFSITAVLPFVSTAVSIITSTFAKGANP